MCLKKRIIMVINTTKWFVFFGMLSFSLVANAAWTFENNTVTDDNLWS